MERLQRVAAYNVCVDDASRLLMCRLSDITERPGWWTLPGGGIDFGEHPEAGALRELEEETGLTGRIVELLAVDSLRRAARAPDRASRPTTTACASCTAPRSPAASCATRRTRARIGPRGARAKISTTLPLVELGRLGVTLAFGPAPSRRQEQP